MVFGWWFGTWLFFFPYIYIYIWQWVKTLYNFGEHQNSLDLWMFIPLKMVLIGIDPYPYIGNNHPN